MKLIFLKTLFFALFCSVFSLSVGAQDTSLKPSDLIKEAKSKSQPTSFELFNLNSSRGSVDLPSDLTNYSLLNLDRAAIKNLLDTDQKFIQIAIPQQDRATLTLELVEVNIFALDFVLKQAPDMTPIKAPLGRHYRGTIKDQKLSVVSLSVFDNEVSAIISHPLATGNLVIGKLANSTSHILYQDDQIKHLNQTSCSTPDGQASYSQEELRGTQIASRSLSDCIRLYLEVDNDIYINKGSNNASVTSYITGLMNQVATLYANEQINTVISEMVIWSQPSPYNSTSSSGMLNAFTAYRQGFNGDLAQLLSYKASGGIAYVDGLCRSNPDYSMSYAGINSSYQSVPTYSWSVEVVTHEFGHLFGSQHTHACAWNGNNTAIDGCYTVEGSCGSPGLPPVGAGTIMSYCHLTNVGINFSNGFGAQPGNIIRNRVTNANCLSACAGGDGGGGPAPCTDNQLTLNLRTDNYPGETSWNIKNSANVTVYSGASYGAPNTLNVIDLCMPVGCFTYTINDSYGDGICCAYGQGYFNIKQNNSTLISGGQFGTTQSIQFCVTSNGAPTCSDGIQNGNETGIDCGGSCAPCPTCNDGVRNGNETGIDCGGSCAPCPTCNDGVRNGNETGIDCGGSCAPCTSCNDGIQNGNETGIDCGGSCAPCNTNGGNVVVTNIAGNYFETGWDGWIDGGSDCFRYSGSLSPEGNTSIRLRDNSDIQSAMTSQNYNFTTYDSITVEFKFRAVGMENDKQFTIRYSNGSTWSTINTYTAGTDFNNNDITTKKIKISSNLVANASLRIQCNAADNSDIIYVDAVIIKGYKTSGTPAPTCTDGIRNGNETGIDCGGSCAPCATCNDGIRNGNETGIDCGGTCPVCPTCNDGIQNGNETGVDCGGSCNACPTCNDGIQNGSETGIDCGGSCIACPSCNDGIQNGSETGVDCGGSCNACPGSSTVTLSAHYFETGWDGWIDGGGDCFRYIGNLSPEGQYSIRIRDNSGEQSAMTSQSYNLSPYQTVNIEFRFRAVSMEAGKDFWILLNNGNNTWTNIATFVSGTHFVNDVVYTTTVTLTGSFSNNSQFRIQADADSNEDIVYIDAVTISASTGSSLIGEPIAIKVSGSSVITENNPEEGILMKPNPVSNDLYLQSEEEIQKIVIYTTSGSVLSTWIVNDTSKTIDVSNFPSGLYLIQITTLDGILTKKFIKN